MRLLMARRLPLARRTVLRTAAKAYRTLPLPAAMRMLHVDNADGVIVALEDTLQAMHGVGGSTQALGTALSAIRSSGTDLVFTVTSV
jgi:hypothetical protein